MAAQVGAPPVLATMHTWMHERRGQAVTSAYVLVHTDPSCPEAATGTTCPVDPEGWPCSACYQTFPARHLPAVTGPSVDAPERNAEGTGTRAPDHRGPSEAQLRFLLRLAGSEAVLADIERTARAAGQWTVRGASRIIDRMKAEADARPASPATVRRNARPGTCHDCGAHVPAEAGSLVKGPGGWEVRCMPACAPRPATGPVAPAPPVQRAGITAGMYRAPDGTIWRVQPGRESGRLYAKVLLVFEGGASFEYDAGALARIDPAWRMTIDEAIAYGQATGICCVCGRELRKAESIEAGIGPVCAAKF